MAVAEGPNFEYVSFAPTEAGFRAQGSVVGYMDPRHLTQAHTRVKPGDDGIVAPSAISPRNGPRTIEDAAHPFNYVQKMVSDIW
jgi:hypothetical protein